MVDGIYSLISYHVPIHGSTTATHKEIYRDDAGHALRPDATDTSRARCNILFTKQNSGCKVFADVTDVDINNTKKYAATRPLYTALKAEPAKFKAKRAGRRFALCIAFPTPVTVCFLVQIFCCDGARCRTSFAPEEAPDNTRPPRRRPVSSLSSWRRSNQCINCRSVAFGSTIRSQQSGPQRPAGGLGSTSQGSRDYQ